MALANWFYLCMGDKEFVDTLLIHYAKKTILWELLFSILGTTWVTPGKVNNTLLS